MRRHTVFDHDSDSMQGAAAAADELPELAIQSIQSFLPTEEAARSSVLSKSWLRSHSTHPCLDFDQSLLFGVDPLYQYYKKYSNDKYPGGIEQVRSKFVDFVNTTLLRYTTQKLRILKFRLSATMLTSDHADLIDEWIRLALDTTTTTNELHLVLSSYSHYTFPQTLLFSTHQTSLEVLFLSGCNFIMDIDDPIHNFHALKTLVLEFAYIDDRTIASVISGIPLVESITLTACKGFTRIKVTSNLDHLKVLKILAAGNSQIFDIEAPNLEDFMFSRSSLSKAADHEPPPSFYMINNAILSKVKSLYLDSASITDVQLNDLLRQCMVIGALTLSQCDELESINISGRPSLTRLDICLCRKLVAVTIDAPNLCWFTYSCDNLRASISVVNYCSPSKFWPLHIHLMVTACPYLSTSWFLQLRRFLKTMNHKVGTLSVIINNCNQNSFSSEKFVKALDPSQAHSYRTKVEGLLVTISSSSSSSSIRYPALLDGLFWNFHPTNSLTIAWKGTNSDKESRAFSKLLRKKLLVDGENLSSLYKKLMHSRRNTENYWLHYLKDAETWSWKDSEFRCDLGRHSI